MASEHAREYTFAGAAPDRERARLERLERAFDPTTRELLVRAGLGAGQRVLEVGAGAGSIAAFLADRVGGAGRVTAIDLDVSFLPPLPAHVDVVRGDVRAVPLGGDHAIAHARYVLVHNVDPDAIVERLIAALAPGGSLVLEEPDFTAVRTHATHAGSSGEGAAFARTGAAVVATFTGAGKDPALGLRLPALCAARGLIVEHVVQHAPLCRGGDEVATMMAMSAAQLRERYLATGLVTDDDLAGYARFAADPSAWAVYYATIGIIARKPAAPS